MPLARQVVGVAREQDERAATDRAMHPLGNRDALSRSLSPAKINVGTPEVHAAIDQIFAANAL